MKKIIFSFAAFALLLISCGPDSELVASGKSHSCKIRELSKQLEADPGNPEIMEEIARYSRYLKIVIESAGEGGQAELEEAIIEASKNCD